MQRTSTAPSATDARSDGFVRDLHEIFSVGQTTTVRIIRIDTLAQQLTARIKDAVTPSLDAVDVGTAYDAKVAALHSTMVSVALQPSGVAGLISHARLARSLDTAPDQLRATLKVGDKLSDLVVTAKDEAKNLVMVNPSNIGGPSRVGAIGPDQRDTAIDELSEGQKMEVRVISTTAHGLLVQVARNLKGRVHWTDMSDDYDLPKPVANEIINAVIVSLDVALKRVDLSLRQSVVEGSVVARDPVVSTASNLQVDERVRGIVTNIADAGLFLALGRSVTARVQIKVRGTQCDVFDARRTCSTTLSRSGNRGSRSVKSSRAPSPASTHSTTASPFVFGQAPRPRSCPPVSRSATCKRARSSMA